MAEERSQSTATLFSSRKKPAGPDSDILFSKSLSSLQTVAIYLQLAAQPGLELLLPRATREALSALASDLRARSWWDAELWSEHAWALRPRTATGCLGFAATAVSGAAAVSALGCCLLLVAAALGTAAALAAAAAGSVLFVAAGALFFSLAVATTLTAPLGAILASGYVALRFVGLAWEGTRAS
uniref:Transmembrane protein n=1 Tax=Tetraselmis sp. GSL018 TaxID=582737 RepID=A0A061S4W0_9CHLO|mmetsp:Transcript_12382/g.29418  ORF Transcript_12382/g.29418 Transcript_12382/m.29418 type:complete len:184 (+) Transcript_12382:136-687(+)